MSIAFSLVRKAVFAASLLSFAASAFTFASAQQNNAVSGGLAGNVTDTSGAAVPNAQITIVGPQGTTNLVSDAKGQYEVRGLTPGFYTITVKATGFTTFVSKENQVTIDHTASLNVPLAVGNEGVTVEVDGGATAIDVENSSVNTQITDTFISDLPLPRNVSGAFYAAPGVVSGGGTGTANPSIGGSSGLENNYSADGVTITDQSYGGLGVYTPQYGSLGTGITQAYVKEVDVKTAGFEPKYGQGDGGIVEIVTKSGSNKFHASLGAYVTPPWAFAGRKQAYAYSTAQVTTPLQTLSTPQYEGALTAGGYILKDKLFFFGAFDPTLNQNKILADPASSKTAAVYALGTQTQSATSVNWAGKITYSPFANTQIELSSYGDPSRRNVAPFSLSGTNISFFSDSYNYGTRNSTARVNTVLFKGITAFGAYAYSTEHFNDSPLAANTYSISDRTGTTIQPYGFGTYYKTKDANYTLTGEMQASGNFFGKHTAMIGYFYNHVDFANSTLRTGPSFGIPAANADGTALTALYTNVPAGIAGKLTNASYYLRPVLDPSTGLPFAAGTSGCAYCAKYNGVDAYLQQIRGTYSGSTVNALSRYKAAYGNEIYSPNKYLTITAGLRWEQQTYGGSLLTYNWRDNWSPRVGASIDPFGTRKNKLSFQYSRYQNPLPLDAAIRQLGNEQDDTSFYYAPVKDENGNAVVDANGAVTPNTSAFLNGTTKLTGTNFGAPNFGSSTGEGILPGTKMEFADEYLFSVEHEIKPGMVLKVRYIDRQFARIVEDIGSTSPEGALVDANYAGGIANVTANSDYFVNEAEVTYTPDQFKSVNSGRTPGQVTAANYVAPAPGCTYGNDTSVANGGFFTHFDTTPYNGACVTNAGTDGASYAADGKPDGFADPRRHYQGLEVEFDKAFSHHWQAIVNYRYAKLFGNYEGFYRNDNGQSDPGISSLFDFTQGAINLLGDQFKRGYLNSDRRSVANALVSYNIGKDTPYLGMFKGVTVGTWIHGLSGTPLSAYQSHPIYLNPGEVPVGGRGTLGTTPVNVYIDGSVSDTFTFFDKYFLKAGFDGFNLFNSQAIITKNQNLDTSPGVNNLDYGVPTSFVTAFRARFNIELSF